MSDPALTEWLDEPDTEIIEALKDSDPPMALHLAQKKLHAIAQRPTPSPFPATEPPTLPDRKKHEAETSYVKRATYATIIDRTKPRKP